ncbi:MAG: SIMPL domain-containing protein [Candidatus Gracilibacteria bacterium]|jgi:hypothetical protein
MNSFLRNLLGLAIIITLGGGLFLGYKFTQSYDRVSSPTNFRSFVVQGDGKAVGVPDIAGFSFEVITEGGVDVAALQSQNADKMNAAIAFVTKQGVDKKDIATSQYTILPRYETPNCVYGSGKVCPPATIVGYTVQQSVHVKIRDFKLISPLLTGVVTSGANSVSNIQFAIDDSTKIENTARAEAIHKAQEKAQSVADAAGFTLGRLLEISENNAMPYYNQPMLSKGMMDSVSSSTAPTIEPGSQEVTINVTLKYEIN